MAATTTRKKKATSSVLADGSISSAEMAEGVTSPIEKPRDDVVTQEHKQYAPEDMISVRSTVSGMLLYKSILPQGGVYIWNSIGESCEIPYSELMIMRNSQRAFFEKNWIVADRDVLEQLDVARYYSTEIDYDNVDAIFKMSPSDIEKTISVISDETKGAIRVRAISMYKSGALDSVQKIRALERALNIDLL